MKITIKKQLPKMSVEEFINANYKSSSVRSVRSKHNRLMGLCKQLGDKPFSDYSSEDFTKLVEFAKTKYQNDSSLFNGLKQALYFGQKLMRELFERDIDTSAVKFFNQEEQRRQLEGAGRKTVQINLDDLLTAKTKLLEGKYTKLSEGLFAWAVWLLIAPIRITEIHTLDRSDTGDNNFLDLSEKKLVLRTHKTSSRQPEGTPPRVIPVPDDAVTFLSQFLTEEQSGPWISISADTTFRDNITKKDFLPKQFRTCNKFRHLIATLLTPYLDTESMNTLCLQHFGHTIKIHYDTYTDKLAEGISDLTDPVDFYSFHLSKVHGRVEIAEPVITLDSEIANISNGDVDVDNVDIHLDDPLEGESPDITPLLAENAALKAENEALRAECDQYKAGFTTLKQFYKSHVSGKLVVPVIEVAAFISVLDGYNFTIKTTTPGLVEIHYQKWNE